MPYLPFTILVAEDDPDDLFFIQEALEENRVADYVSYVRDGEELLDYLKRRGSYDDPACAPRPDVILLDLNMPRKDGREALEEIKADPELKQIPVIAYTTSKSEEDVVSAYKLGVSGFVTKPTAYTDILELTRRLGLYWAQTVTLPSRVY